MSTVRCELCPRYCAIPDGKAGDCRIRVNLGGKLVATTFGRPSAAHIDPMEKKPLFHFLPGTTIFSIATAGCNLHCNNCQNWELSQRDPTEMEVVYQAPPAEVVALAAEKKCLSIAYTYSEPLVYYEYVEETARLARERGIKNVLVTAGYVNREPLKRLCRVIDATNTDLKGFSESFYRDNCGGSLKPVLDALVVFREEGVWQEITHLVIPTLNDDLAMVRSMCRWMHTWLGADTPLHFSRFHPQYRLRNLPPTPVETLVRCREVALEAGLRYVYIGNVLDEGGEETRCPQDGTPLVKRYGFTVRENRLENGACPVCRRPIPGVWS